MQTATQEFSLQTKTPLPSAPFFSKKDSGPSVKNYHTSQRFWNTYKILCLSGNLIESRIKSGCFMTYPKICLTLNLLPAQSSCQTASKVHLSFRSLCTVRSCCLFLLNDPLLTDFCENAAQTAEANCSHEEHVQHSNFNHVHDSQFDEVSLFVLFLVLISSSKSARNNHPSSHTNKH